jgi:predicted ribosomally synthesized peptide with nif11-like leader
MDSAKGFVERMKKDAQFAQKVAGAASKDERIGILRSAGFKFTKQEFLDAAGELSESDLSGVVGGVSGGGTFSAGINTMTSNLRSTSGLGWKCDTYEVTSECIC